jgi:hypothetical protein
METLPIPKTEELSHDGVINKNFLSLIWMGGVGRGKGREKPRKKAIPHSHVQSKANWKEKKNICHSLTCHFVFVII